MVPAFISRQPPIPPSTSPGVRAGSTLSDGPSYRKTNHFERFLQDYNERNFKDGNRDVKVIFMSLNGRGHGRGFFMSGYG